MTKRDPADLITLAAASEMLGLDTSRVRRLAREGALRATKVGSTWLTTTADVRAFEAVVRPRGRPAAVQSTPATAHRVAARPEPRGTPSVTQAEASASSGLSGSRTSFAASSRLIGRSDELERAIGVVTAPPATLFVEGEAGIGKSRLVAELLQRPELEGVRALVGTSHPLRDPFPLGPLVDALRRVTVLPDARAFPPLVGALRPLLPELADRLPPAPPVPADPRAERHILFRAIREVLGQLGPTVCVLEDLHWSDAATVEFLRFLIPELPPNLAVVLTYRREDISDAGALLELFARASFSTPVYRLRLEPLGVEAVQAMVATILDVPDVSDDLGQYVHERTAGIPFAVEELVRVLREKPDIARRGGNWLRRELDALAVPATIRDSMLARLARLGRDARLIAEAAAVIGVPAGEELLLPVAGVSESRAAAAIREAVEAAVLQPMEGDRYALRHALAIQAIHDGLPAAARRRMHLRAAQTLERIEPSALARLSDHYRLAGRTRWTACAEAAADAASAQHDDAAAARFLHAILTAPHLSTGDRARVAIKLARAALNGHAYTDQAVAVARELVAGAGLPRRLRGHLRALLGILLTESGDASAGHREQTLAVRELRDQPQLAALMMANLALPTAPDVAQAENRRWLRRASDVAERQSDLGIQRIAQACRVLVPVYFGDTAGLVSIRELGEPRGADGAAELLMLQAHLAGALFYLGHYQRARYFLAEADRAAGAGGWGRYQPMRTTALLMLEWAGGEWYGLAERSERVGAVLEMDHPPSCAVTQLISGSLALAAGDAGAAERTLSGAADRALGSGVVPVLIAALGALVRAMLARGRVDDAAAAADRGLEVLDRTDVWVWAAELAPAAVDAFLQNGRDRDAAALVTRFGRGLRGTDAPLGGAALSLCRALLTEAGERRAPAAREFARAELAYRSLPRPYDAALAGARGGAWRLERGDSGGADGLVAALESFERLGATADAARCRMILRQHSALRGRVHGSGRRAYGADLSPREQRVAELAADGLSYAEIARTLFVSTRTVENQLRAALRKLGLPSKTALIHAWAAGGRPAGSASVQVRRQL